MRDTMPTVEKTTGGRVYYRPLKRRFEIGDQTEVSEEHARYLCEERGDFDVVDGTDEAVAAESDATDDSDEDGDEDSADETEDVEPDDEASADEDVEAEDDAAVDEDLDRDIDLQNRMDLESVGHGSLKEIAEELGIAEDTDLRSKATIIDAIIAETRED